MQKVEKSKDPTSHLDQRKRVTLVIIFKNTVKFKF